jgi:hypothetical protein
MAKPHVRIDDLVQSFQHDPAQAAEAVSNDPGEQSRRNAIGARSVESCFDPAAEARMVEDFERDASRAYTQAIGEAFEAEDHMAGDLHAMGSVPGMTAANFPGTIDPASHPLSIKLKQEKAKALHDADMRQGFKPASHANPIGGEQEHGEPVDDSDIQGQSPPPTTKGMGNVPAMPSPEPAPDDPVSRAKALAASVMNRLKASKQWFGLVDLVRDQMMKDAKAAYPDLVQRQLWVYGELERLYLEPAPILPIVNDSDTISESPHLSPYVPTKRISESGQPSLPGLTDAGAIQGLSEIPEGWPTLPANASLGAELGWVQANRLRIVEERPGKATRVQLSLALSPAPSWAALGWLETSIRSYAKFVDVAAKAASGGDDDEGAVLRRERKSVDEVRALLGEMKQAEGSCPACGRPH